MPNDSLRAIAQAMPADHPDAAIFAAVRALAAADEEFGRAASRADAVRASAEGREITQADNAALAGAAKVYEAALDALLAHSPRTALGVRAILRAIVEDGGRDKGAILDALERLADCPALAAQDDAPRRLPPAATAAGAFPSLSRTLPMSRWYRAYEGTVTDAKLGEVPLVAERSRAVVIATWHAVLESCASVNDGGRFDTTPRRVAAILGEPVAKVEGVFSAFTDLGMIDAGRVTLWTRRQFPSDSSTLRCRKHRARRRAALEAARLGGEATP